MAATLSNAMPDAASTAGSSGSGGRCENADCNAVKLISMVPKRKTTQFVTEPSVMEKPMLINGFTTVFQVDGTSAKLSDLKNANPNDAMQPKTIFRIVPNRHSHIVNYVVVDADGDSLRKINESDPATMRKLLESQKVSADQMLQKLMAGHGVAAVPLPPTTTTLSVTTARSPVIAPVATSTLLSKQPTSNVVYGTPSNAAQTTPPIQLPVRMHPNLKITAVAGAENVSALTAPPATQQPVIVPPLITPVPLANLQSGLVAATVTPPQSQPVVVSLVAPVVDTVEKPVFDKMQAELQELRRTVAMLAEAQAKTLQNQQQQTQQSSRGSKRPRQN